MIRPIFQRVFGRGVTLVFSAEETAREVAETLARKGIENEGGARGLVTVFSPPATRSRSVALGERFLQLPLGEVEHVERRRPQGFRMSPEGRRQDELRPVEILAFDTSSSRMDRVLYSQGKTKVLCSNT